MENFRNAKEILDYVKQFWGKIIVIKVSKVVLANSKKLANVIRDIILLKSAGIEIIVTHSDTQFVSDPWLSLEPVVFLDISTISGITGQIALGITPVIFFGETPSLSSEKAIASLAIKIGAVKIIYVTNYDGVFQSGKSLIHEMNTEQTKKRLETPSYITKEMRRRVEVALIACAQGIPRVHIIGSREGSLLKEILTCHGSGTMIYESLYQEIREAKKTDVPEIFEVIRESIKTTTVPFEFIEKNLSNFLVFAIDQQVYGCMLIRKNFTDSISEIAYLGMLPTQEDPLIFERLIKYGLENISHESRFTFLDPEKNTNLLGIYPWFKRLGFAKCSLRECGIENGKKTKMWIKKNIQ